MSDSSEANRAVFAIGADLGADLAIGRDQRRRSGTAQRRPVPAAGTAELRDWLIAAGRLAASAAVMEPEFHDRPFGAVGAFIAPPRSAEPASPVSPSFVIPPPDWDEVAGEQQAAESAAPTMTAVERMMADAAASGELEEQPAPGLPVHVEPLQRAQPLPPNWQEEERLAIELNRRAELERARLLLAEEQTR